MKCPRYQFITKRALVTLLAVISTVAFAMTAKFVYKDPSAPYLDPNRPIPDRVSDLIARMTLAQKMTLLSETMEEIPGISPKYHVGNEALHGVVRPQKATIFPQAIALASSWDVALHERIATAISDEARAMHNALDGETRRYAGLLTFFSPTINMARDPRWGRTPETYGEDPYLTGRLGVAYVKGMQGNDPKYLKVATTAKHFAANNQEMDRDKIFAEIPAHVLHEYFLPAFKDLVTEGEVTAVMSAYNGINGVPCTANKYLLTDLLKGEWGFKGYVVSDCGAVGNLYTSFKLADSYTQAAAMALNAGVDLECGDSVMKNNLSQALAAGLVDNARIEEALSRILTIRFRLGMYDDKELVPYSKLPPATVGSEEHKALARESARESIVLLKNAPIAGDKLLPINTQKIKKITVLGPHADTMIYGDYSNESGPANDPMTPLAGIRRRLAKDNVMISHVDYYPKAGGTETPGDLTELAKNAAMDSDLVIAFMGADTAREHEGVDRSDIALYKEQSEYLAKIFEANSKIVLVLVNGGPLSINAEQAYIPAILETWFSGEQGGNAIADVLFADYNPAGRMPLTTYKSINDLLPLADYDITKGRTYMYFTGDVLYPFGYGLSYTTYAYSNLRMSETKMGPHDSSVISVDIRNSGDRAGDEVVQLYIHAQEANVIRPREQLRGFSRIHLQPGETKRVDFMLNHHALATYDVEARQFVTTPGFFDVMIGASSADIRVKGVLEAL